MPSNIENINCAIRKYRNKTFRYLPELRLKSESEAIDYVNERQFIFFWPIKNIPMPSLWGAVAGDRPVPNNHDDPGHITWRWKDSILGQKKWYYAKILRRKSTIISLDLISSFFAFSDSALHTIDDFRYLYRTGKRSRLELEIFSLLLSSGPMDTISIRKKLRNSFSFSSSEFNRAMENMQKQFYILPMGISENGRWHYSYQFDIVENLYPEKIKTAYQLKKSDAMDNILSAYFQSNGIASTSDIKKLLQWKNTDIHRGLESLTNSGIIKPLEIEKTKEIYYAYDNFQMKNDL